MKNHTIYQAPIDELLTLGNCHTITNEYNYIAQLGLDTKHIPGLISMAVDQNLNGADSTSLEAWGSIHACRALGQLRAEAAIEPLMQLFHELEDSEWVNEEMPKVYGMFGEVAIPRLQAYLADASHGIFPRITAIHSLEEICKQHPDTRQKCIAVLTQQLKSFAQNPHELNGFIVASLIELQAVESAAVIKSAFAAQSVPDEITGTWDDVCESLGVHSDKIALFTDINLDEVSQVEDIYTDDVTQTKDVSKTEEIAANQESQLQDISADDLTQTQEIADSEETQLENVIPNDLTQTEDISQAQEIADSEETQLENVIPDDVPQVEDVSQIQAIYVEKKQSEQITTEEVEKISAITSEHIQLIEDMTTDVEQLDKVENKTDEQKQPSEINNRAIEINQLKSKVDNQKVTASVKQQTSKGFGGFATSPSKAKTNKKKKR
ncbi:HEAT repeat domain-containing protein [Fischerella sp. JS2]|uniref:HEAT repeat domain-containing protein n=1 Tax=Fischerella sp. JS2 TaxID=2597771 RepID=UPI0028EECD05|nr:HEAT repeat domain-containing protein [Fischerella sp. JS2]